MASNTTQATASGDLVDLVSSSSTTTIYPSDDTILAVLQARFRADLPYTRIGATNLVVVNPYKTLANVNNISAKEYEERCYKDTSLPMVDSPKPLQPHPYDLAAKLYLFMRRRHQSQALLARGITGSGKSSTIRLFINQILRLSTHSRKEAKIAEQVKAACTVLDSFGNTKTLMNPNASRHGRYLELHFNERGRISSSKVLTYALDKSRLTRLTHEERSFHVFYQLLAGATTAERDQFNLEDPSDYALLASSGTYRLPSGPFSDDSIGMSDLRASMRTLGFKQKHMSSIFSVLVAILLLGNLQFHDGDAHTVSAYIANTHVLDQVARLLGTSSDDLNQVLTNKTSYVRKELYTVLLSAEQSAAQRDQCVRDLYSILFAFVVETANHRLAPSSKDPLPYTQIVTLDQPGFQTRGPSGTSSMALTGTAPLVSIYGQNSISEFCINFADELLQSYILRNTFEDSVGYNAVISSDGIALPSIVTMGDGACIELLRGAQLSERSQRKPNGLLGILNKSSSAFKSGKGDDHRDEDMLQELVTKFGVHASFIANPGPASEKTLFGINHYSGSVSYDVTKFVERDSDLLDSAFVTLLRHSTEPFVAKLLSGPSLAAERHSKDENIIVQSQVSSRPLRQATPIPLPNGDIPEEHAHLDPSKTYPVTSQLNFTMSEIFASLDRTHLWNLACIRPNDSGSPNSFDKRRVKAQIRSLLLPDVTARRTTEYVADYDIATFCERYVPTMRGSDEERLTQCARANGWREGTEFARGSGRVWLSYVAWKMVEDTVRAVEKEQKRSQDDEDEGSMLPDDGTEYTHPEQAGLAVPGTTSGYFNESADNLLLTRMGPDGTRYQDPNAEYGGGGLSTPGYDARGFGGRGRVADGSGEWDVDSKGVRPYSPNINKAEGSLVVKDAPNTVEQIPTSRARRWWLGLVWLCTWLIPSFALKYIGRMKRPDIQIAWREKVAICWLILLLNGMVDFRKTARCQTQNYLLIVMSGILMASIGLKFLAALQFGSKRQPELQDKFVLCQVPCYTEGEDSLRRTVDSLAALNYDDKRKLIFIICDGNIIGSGNDRTTPRIVLDILGVDPKLDPEPLLFKSVGEGSKALNYGKVYSGLYEFEGHVVPYMVVVKVGKPTERSKPGNRGKRDSQILLLHYLNRVHFDAPMSPLELEIYHQMRNVIGIDPAFYEYIFTIDADTTVTPEALNRLVAMSADDSSIIGVCGETKLQNEEGSWWTMIQVYEYYISHHLSKAFESLFGSVTCLPGCFTLFRIRTSDKGRPIIISNRIIDEYAEPNVDTLHKKNLFSLGEDRFLTTLLMKHFPTFKTKFCPDAIARTVAPESWRILFSQRRRWINSTIHNLCELVLLPELFGFCCFSMRFFVFIDLLGTLILPATVVYLFYLIIVVSTHQQALPMIAIIMIAVTYGLQA
ncbi:hypothetical protein C0992_009697 [Termitomyces sp. T32_za158]|nr:hypothetical protein C0992_009697 [Termitomyces sp. T32_za158]